MPQLFPDGPAAVNLNALRESGGINVPAEPAPELDTPGMQGSMQQILSENLGKYIMADFLIGVSNIVRRVGILYSVGRGFLVLYEETTHTFDVCDIFSLKFATFFPPGFEPSLDEVLSGAYPSGILSPYVTRSMAGENALQTMFGGSGTMGGMGSAGNQTMGGGMNTGMNAGMNGGANTGMSGNAGMGRSGSGNGCRTLGQR